jgi:hypothetical protein
VGVENALDYVGRGEIVPPNMDYTPPDGIDARAARFNRRYRGFEYAIGGSKVPPEYWSSKFQWLPANVGFREDGTAQFTSCINNLHPTKHRNIYQALEKLVDAAIPSWSQCLAENRVPCPGMSASRFSKPDYDCR